MNILYTINSTNRGGAEQHVADLVEGMVQRGHKVYVWCPEGEFFDIYKTKGAHVTKAKIYLDIDPIYIFKLTKFLIVKKIDIVHAHELKAVINTLFAANAAGVRIKVTHSHTPISEWQISELKKAINIHLFNTPFVNMFSTREIALTETRRVAKIKEGIYEAKLEIIPNGIKIEDFTFDTYLAAQYKKEMRARYEINDTDFVFGSLGRLSKEKGTADLIAAFAKLLTKLEQINSIERDNLKLFIGGGGVLYEQMKKLAKSLNIEDKVIFTDIYRDEDKAKLFNLLDVFVFPSLAEGFGFVLIEAMAMSLPIIASDLEVLQEVGGSSVIFFDTGNVDDLSEKMFNLYQKRERLDNLKLENRQRVEALYTMSNFIDNYENLYLKLLEEDKR